MSTDLRHLTTTPASSSGSDSDTTGDIKNIQLTLWQHPRLSFIGHVAIVSCR